MISEFEDAYDDVERLRGALLATPISEFTLRQPIQVDAASTVAEAIQAMNEHRTGCVLVQKEGKLAGIFTERDVLTRVIDRLNTQATPVFEVMTRNPESLAATETIAFALNKMSVGGYRHIPIIDSNGQPSGVLSVRDIVDYLTDLFAQDVINLPPNSRLGMADSADGG